MKHSLLLSLLCILPLHAMEHEKIKDDAFAHLITQKGEPQPTKIIKAQMRKKVLATVLLSTLITAGMGASALSARHTLDLTNVELFPGTPLIRPGCKYLPVDAWVTESGSCTADGALVPKEFCECKEPYTPAKHRFCPETWSDCQNISYCPAMFQECPAEDIIKKPIIVPNITALVTQAAAWLVGMIGIWHSN